MPASAETLLAGIWLGSYLFTTFIVSPGLNSLAISQAERVSIRSAFGRRYGLLSLPLLLIWFVLLFLQTMTGWVLVRLVLLVLLTVTVALHGYLFGSRLQRLAREEAAGSDAAARERSQLQRLSGRITPLALILSVVLAALTLV